MPHFIAIFTCVGLAILGSGSAEATPLLGHNFGSILYDVDPSSGAVSNPRDTGIFGPLDGISLSAQGVLFGLSNNDRLFQIDPTTGTSTLVGSLGVDIAEGDIDFDPTTGLLYGLTTKGDDDHLFLIDPGSGVATLTATLQSNIDPSAMAFDAKGTLYVLDTLFQRLLTVDKATGTFVTEVALSSPLGSVAGMDFDPATGVLFVADGAGFSTDTLYTLDYSTGLLDPIGATVEGGLSGLEFIPEPSSLSLLFLGGLAMRLRGRRSSPH